MTEEATKLLFKSVKRFKNNMNLLDLKIYHEILFKKIEENEDRYLDKSTRENGIEIYTFKPEYLKYMVIYCEQLNKL